MNPSLSLSSLELPALEGSNPLGFLAALGTLVTLQKAGHPHARLGWRRTVHWRPVLHGLSTCDPQNVADAVSGALRGTKVAAQYEKERESAQRAFDAAKKAVKDKRAEIKKRKLKGDAREIAYAEEVAPLEQVSKEKRDAWLAALKLSVPTEELALGRHIDCTPEEYREHALSLIQTASQERREASDFLAAFGSDAIVERNGRIRGTPFCFITGSGHQYFLDTVRQLIEQVNTDRVYQTLFLPWEYRDEKLSMRWDPIEDRRYALMDRDPTASDNKARTVWMANLLAYRGLALFSSAPTLRGLETTGWIGRKSKPVFTWPIWEEALSCEVIKSLLQLQELYDEELDRSRIRARGIVAIFRSQRIQVGNPPLHKINFTPASSL
jgi:hypothetical protein